MPGNLNLFAYVRQSPIHYYDPAGKWSSQSRAMGRYQPVHQQAIRNVLANQVGPVALRILENQQILIDENQGNADQFMHAMTGAGQDRAQVINQANTFVKTKLEKAMASQQAGRVEEAYRNLGDAIHTLQDATSPSHRGFQVWDDDASWTHKLGHVEAERKYPAEGSVEYRQIVGVTQWAYDIFTGKARMPERFFEPQTGALNLPTQYTIEVKE